MSIRSPLRPLARIIEARQKGENPDAIERENLRLRHEATRDRMRLRAESRLILIAAAFVFAYGAVGYQMAALATSEPAEPRIAAAPSSIVATRADIVDRDGRVMATNFATNALYAHPHEIVDPQAAAEGLAEIFPNSDADAWLARLESAPRFVWLRRYISPEQEQMVHDLGEPGLHFGARDMRLYPNGSIAAHVLGGARFGEEAVNAAEIQGIAGVEMALDATLRDPDREAPLRLSLDLTVQAAVEEVLGNGLVLMGATGASAVLMEADTGEIVALASLPDFDPNARPVPLLQGDQADDPLFNRAVLGAYELGSVFKTFTTAQALDLGLVSLSDELDTRGPLRIGGFEIEDFSDHGTSLTVAETYIQSSNIGTARLAQMIGGERQQGFLDALGLTGPTPLEVVEAGTVRVQTPPRWGEIATITVSYGHGLSTSPVHLAAAYAAMVNGGIMVEPTILHRGSQAVPGTRVISEDTSLIMRGLMRDVVVRGTARFGEVEGYLVGGKTGTAEMPRPQGGYYEDRNITTFAGAFPMDDPEYVLILSLYDPSVETSARVERSAGWTAVPVASEVIRRIAPLLGLRPEIETPLDSPLSSSSQ